jgi:hypothetical protein
MTTKILSQSDITQIQQHFYKDAAEAELAPDEPYEYNGVKFKSLQPFTVGPNSKFNIHEFARAIEEKVREKISAKYFLTPRQ